MPKPLIYFSYGMTRTGSTFAFELVRTALEYCGYAQGQLQCAAMVPNRRINFMRHITELQAQQLCDEVREIGHPIVIKTHTRPDDPAVVQLLQSGFAIGHAVYRDPRDMALSMLDSGIRAREKGLAGFAEIESLEDAFANIRHQTNTLTAWLRLPGVIPLYFEDVAFDSEKATRKILAQLGLEADAQFIANYVRANRFTQKNKARRHRYPDEMSAQTSASIAKEFSPLIQDFIINRAALPDDGSVTLPAPRHLRTTAQDE